MSLLLTKELKEIKSDRHKEKLLEYFSEETVASLGRILTFDELIEEDGENNE